MIPDGYSLRYAKGTDRPSFMRLWRSFQVEQHSLGSHILPTDDNLREFARVFDCYTIGSMFGVCVLATDPQGKDVGVVLAGEDRGLVSLETNIGWCLTMWGVYVEPEHRKLGLAHGMQDHGLVRCRDLGFQSVGSSVLLTSEEAKANALNWGTEGHSLLIYGDLGDIHGKRIGRIRP